MPPARPRASLAAFAIYPTREPVTIQRYDADAFAPIEGYTLAMYAAVSRALLRLPSSSTRQLHAALGAHGLTPDRWTRIRSGWTARIAADPYVRGAFRRMFLAEATASASATDHEGGPA